MAQRATRGALTYQRGRHEALVERLWEAARAGAPLPAASEVVARLGGDLLSFRADAPDALDRLLQALPVDDAQLSDAVDAALAAEPEMATGLRDAQAQLFPGAQVDRDVRLGPESVRSHFVLCTRRMYAAHAQDVFAGFEHLETADPFAVLMVQHQAGLRFMALSYLRGIHASYAALPTAERALGHLTTELATTLPALEP